MNNMETAIYISEQTLTDYVTSRKIDFQSKDYEYLVAFFLLKFRQRFDPEYNVVGFVLDPTKSKDVPPNGTASMDELSAMLDRQDGVTTEDTEIDVVLGKQVGEVVGKKVLAFQIKRFGLGKEKGAGTEGFKNFLIKIEKHYSKNLAVLLIVLETTTDVLMTQEISDWLKGRQFPFRQVDIVAIEDGKWKVIQLMPCPSMEEIPLEDLR